MGLVAELAGSPALVSLSPSALSLLSFPSCSEWLRCAVAPPCRGCVGTGSHNDRSLTFLVIPDPWCQKEIKRGQIGGEGRVAVQGEGEGWCKVPAWVFLTLSVVWIPAGQLTKHRDCLIWQLPSIETKHN